MNDHQIVITHSVTKLDYSGLSGLKTTHHHSDYHRQKITLTQDLYFLKGSVVTKYPHIPHYLQQGLREFYAFLSEHRASMHANKTRKDVPDFAVSFTFIYF